MSDQPVFESKTESNKFLPTPENCDQIDIDLIKGVMALPNQSILNQDGHLEFDLLLKLYKSLYEHQKAREIDNYIKTLAQRKEQLSNKEIDKVYIDILKNHFFQEEEQPIKSIEIAIKILNEKRGPQDENKKMVSVKHIVQFGIIASQKDPEFGKVHDHMKSGIMTKPVEQEKEAIPEEAAIQIYRERGEIIDNYSRSEQFKEMFEEVYIMVISQNEDATEKSEEVQKAEQKAYFFKGIIQCKANDIISDKYGYTEMQVETSVIKNGLTGKNWKEIEKKDI